jgi:hypothetical protein
MHQPPINSDEVTDYGNITVTARELASVLGLSEQNIYNLKRRGIFQSLKLKAKRNEFQLGPSVRAYIQFKCGRESESEADFHRERAKKERANRELRQILVEQTKGQLHRAEDVRAIVEDSNADIKRRLLKFGKLLTLQVTGKTDPTEVKDIIDASVRKLLNELREYKARDFYRRQKSVAS